MDLTSIKLSLTGAHAWATVSGTLTSGMVGIPVIIEYDEAWEGLTKNLLCRCSPWNSDSGEIRTILNVGETSVVAHEVMQAGQYLYLGVEGFREDGTLVIPTAWARCAEIQYGANTEGDPSADPELPIWNQLLTQIEQIDREGISQEQMDEIRACAETAAQAANTAVDAVNEAARAAQSAAISAGRAEDAAARAEDAAMSFQNPNHNGVTAGQVNALDGMFRVCAFVQDDVSAEYSAFRVAFGLDSGETTDKTLTGISATYSGGSVAVGTAVAALTGIVVTAHYSDGSAAAVTGYALSGTINEGSNTVAVSYGGKSTTITVVGVASGEDVPALETYEYAWDNPGQLIYESGVFNAHGAYHSTGYIDLDEGADAVTLYSAPIAEHGPYIGFFAADGTFVERQNATGAVLTFTVPTGAAKFIVSVQTAVTDFRIYKGEVSAEEVA